MTRNFHLLRSFPAYRIVSPVLCGRRRRFALVTTVNSIRYRCRRHSVLDMGNRILIMLEIVRVLEAA